MQFIIFLSLVALIKGQQFHIPHQGLPPVNPPETKSNVPVWGFFKQKQDNFDPNNNNTWYMRYIENEQFFKKSGPVFIMIGAENEINTGYLQSGQMFEMAKIHKAYMFQTEHRYYGKSYPTRDLTTSSLRFLNIAQALVDLENFITKIKVKYPEIKNSKVVVFGGSYGGSLATWMRQSYPNIVHAAVSSSAPLLAKIDFKECNEVVQRVLGPQCAAVINRGVQDALRLLNARKLKKLKKDFNMCNTLDTSDNYEIYFFFEYIADLINPTVQYAKGKDVSNLCSKIMKSTKLSDYNRLAQFVRNTKYCVPTYKYYARHFKNTSLNSGNSRQWQWQSCTEFGFFQTSWSESSLYYKTIPVELFNKMCLDFFGSRITAEVTKNGVEHTNTNYLNLKPEITRVVSVHGTGDPWSEVGLKKDINIQAPVFIVNGTSHCADLSGLSSSDPPQLTRAKLAVRKYIAQWLTES